MARLDPDRGAGNGGEPAPPLDLAPYRAGNCGLDFVHSWRAERPGPHVMIAALVHGNEPCGAIALTRLMRLGARPLRGRLTLAFMNPAAAERRAPDGGRGVRAIDEDLNRVWSPEALDGQGASLERARARVLRPLIDSVDALLDLHSMHCDGPPLILAGMAPQGLALARAIGGGLPIVRDRGHAGGTRLRDYGGFGQAGSRQSALLAECGPHDDPAAGTRAFELSLRFLAHFGIVPGESAAIAAAAASAPVIEVTDAVTVACGPFEFARDFRGLETVDRAGTLIGRDGAREVRTPYDACTLVMPAARSRPGDTAVRFGRRSAE